MRRPIPYVVPIAVLAVLSIAAGISRAGRVPCTEVLSVSNHLAHTQPSKRGDAIVIAEELRVDALWVERCLRMYGRRITRPANVPRDARQDHIERWEAGADLEELARDEREAGRPRGVPTRRRPFETPTPSAADAIQEEYRRDFSFGR